MATTGARAGTAAGSSSGTLARTGSHSVLPVTALAFGLVALGVLLLIGSRKRIRTSVGA